eukprot:scaffold76623_cov69-Phaeocystis_antarctica.AAC.5
MSSPSGRAGAAAACGGLPRLARHGARAHQLQLQHESAEQVRAALRARQQPARGPRRGHGGAHLPACRDHHRARHHRHHFLHHQEWRGGSA